jgi:hypothetical protein
MKKYTHCRIIRHTLTGILLCLSFVLNAQDTIFRKGERLKFNVYYQWGLIWKKAATATLSANETIFQSNPAVHLRLSASTTSFFDNFLRVRDTLHAITTPQLLPLYYSKNTHEGDYKAKDELTYGYPNGKIVTRARFYRNGELREDTTLAHNSGRKVFDMLSLFYHIRTLNINTLKENQPLVLTVVSGNKPYEIRISFMGDVQLKTPDNKKYNAYKISIILETKKGKKTEREQMEFWMSRDERRVPIQLSGKLPIGSLRAFYEGVE